MQPCSSLVCFLTVLVTCLPGLRCRLFGDNALQPEHFRSTQLHDQSQPVKLFGPTATSTLFPAITPHPLCSGARAVMTNPGKTGFTHDGAGNVEHKTGTYISIGLQGLGHTADQVTTIITGVRQNEPTSGLFSGDQCPDAQVSSLDSLYIRLENSQMMPGNNIRPEHQGRMYHISFAAKLGGTACDGVVSVCIPAIGADSCAASEYDIMHDSLVCPILG